MLVSYTLLEVNLGGLELGTTEHNEKSKLDLKKLCYEAGASTNKQSPDLKINF